MTHRFLYEVCLDPADVNYRPPTPNDNEVESFTLMPLDDVVHLLREKPDSFPSYVRLLLLHFLINHQIITPQNEPGYDEICQRLKQGVGRCAQSLAVGRWSPKLDVKEA